MKAYMETYKDVLRFAQELVYKMPTDELRRSLKHDYITNEYGDRLDINHLSRRILELAAIRDKTLNLWLANRTYVEDIEQYQDDNVRKAIAEKRTSDMQNTFAPTAEPSDDILESCPPEQTNMSDDEYFDALIEYAEALIKKHEEQNAYEKQVEEEERQRRFKKNNPMLTYEDALRKAQEEVYQMSDDALYEYYREQVGVVHLYDRNGNLIYDHKLSKRQIESLTIKFMTWKNLCVSSVLNLELYHNESVRNEIRQRYGLIYGE